MHPITRREASITIIFECPFVYSIRTVASSTCCLILFLLYTSIFYLHVLPSFHLNSSYCGISSVEYFMCQERTLSCPHLPCGGEGVLAATNHNDRSVTFISVERCSRGGGELTGLTFIKYLKTHFPVFSY